MLLVFGFGLLFLAAMVALLFAMCAELASRISAAEAGGGKASVEDPYARPVDRPGVFLRPDMSWPPSLASVSSRASFLLVVLSTSCTSCRDVARQLGDGWADRVHGGLGVVISTPSASTGERFVTDFHLDALPYLIDEDGDWTMTSLGLSLSPVGVVIHGKEIHQTYVFNSVETLWHTFLEDLAGQLTHASTP